MSYDLMFATSNKNKFFEAKKILSNYGIKIGFFKCNLQEIQDISLKKIASHKISEAFRIIKKPVFIEDDGLFIKELNGFPGPFSSYIFKTIGNSGILSLVTSKNTAEFQSVIAFCDNKNGIKLFHAKIRGKISSKPLGIGWGFDPIFVPDGYGKTYALLKNKNEISHRNIALKKFAKWYLRKRESTGQ